MALMDMIKNNPAKTILGSASSIVAVVTALFTIDARYAHAADVAKDKAKTEQIIRETTMDLRKQMLEDKLFELDIKKAQARDQRLTPVDEALRERYARQIKEIADKQRDNK